MATLRDIRGTYYTAQNPASAVKILEQLAAGKTPQDQPDASFPQHAKTPWEIDPYAGKPPEQLYAAVRWYLNASAESPTATAATEAERAAEVLEALETAGLLGMGGAGGRTYKKWQEVREARVTPKYVVCNGDESEPGTFKDREILLRAPHLVVEGVIMGGLVVGAERGIIYIRHEFHEQIHAVRASHQMGRATGSVRPEHFGDRPQLQSRSVHQPRRLHLRRANGALIEAIEDKRAEPRNRPPELQTNGLFDKPTLVEQRRNAGLGAVDLAAA